MNKTWRAAIIGGTGRGNYGHGVDVAFTKVPNVKVVAVADHDPDGRAAARKRVSAPADYADFHQMLAREKPEIVGICPRWIDQHHEMLMAAAEAGAHVYMEKPFCRDLKECDEVVTAFQMRHLKLGIAHVTQYSPVFDTVLKLIRNGEIGDVLEIRGRGKEDRRGGGEDLWVLGSHIFAMMRTLAGEHPASCSAVVTQSGLPIASKHVQAGAEGIGPLAGDRVHAVYQFDNGIVGHFASVRNRGGNPTRFGIQVFGSKGIIELQSGYLKPAFILKDSSWSPGRTGSRWETITSAGIGRPEPRTDGTYEGGHITAISDVISAAEENRETRCSVDDSRGVVEMTAAVFESARLRTPVDLPLESRVNPLTLL